MGEGCCDLYGIDEMMRDVGFEGFREVEIFHPNGGSAIKGNFLMKSSTPTIKFINYYEHGKY